mmetsp:Transcript_85518/g.228758  ORF Transcript_85518/g.228758 Transcript_85518/m.228758 type:complete len:85 (+) Transcript_85518:1039-1293(+)
MPRKLISYCQAVGRVVALVAVAGQFMFLAFAAAFSARGEQYYQWRGGGLSATFHRFFWTWPCEALLASTLSIILSACAATVVIQ